MNKLTKAQAIKKYRVKKTEKGYFCDIPGISYKPSNGNPLWFVRIKNKEIDFDKNASYSIRKHGFVLALQNAVIDAEKWRSLIQEQVEFTVADAKKIRDFEIPGYDTHRRVKSSVIQNRKRKNVVITQDMIDIAKTKYFENGGIVTKINFKSHLTRA